MTADVAIIGVGLHPFGRFPGKSAIEMGAAAARLAMKDAGVEWRDVQFAFGGSYEVDNPDSIVNQLGMTGIPFFNMYNGCATAASVLTQATNTIRLGEYDIGMAIGMDKHVPGAFNADPTLYSLPTLVRRGRHVPHAEVLRREDPAVHARLRHQPDHAGAGGGEELRQRRAQRERVPPDADVGRGRSSSRASSTTRSPSTCSAHPTRARRRSCCAAPIGPTSSPTHRSTCAPRRCAPAGSVRSRCTARRSRSSGSPARRSTCRRRRTRRPASVRRTSTSSSCRTPTPAPRCTTWPRTASAPTATRSGCSPTGRPNIDGPLPINTDGGLIANGEPIGASGLRQIHELVKQLRGQAGDRQVPGNPKVGYAQLYGAPGTAGVSIVSR